MHINYIAQRYQGEFGTAQLINDIFKLAMERGASDIHIEPQNKQVVVRYRLDGLLQTIGQFPPAISSRLITKLKLMGQLDIAEQRLSQDGRLQIQMAAGIMLVAVVPKFAVLFHKAHQTLPIITRQLITTSQWLADYGIDMLILLAIVIITTAWGYRHYSRWRDWCQRVLLSLPGIQHLLHQQALARSCYTSSLMLQLVATGEATGQPDTLLSQLANYYSTRFADSIKRISSLIEPLSLVIIGALITLIVTALYLPMFQMGNVM